MLKNVKFLNIISVPIKVNYKLLLCPVFYNGLEESLRKLKKFQSKFQNKLNYVDFIRSQNPKIVSNTTRQRDGTPLVEENVPIRFWKRFRWDFFLLHHWYQTLFQQLLGTSMSRALLRVNTVIRVFWGGKWFSTFLFFLFQSRNGLPAPVIITSSET